MSDLIVKGAGEIKDGLYNIKDGKLFKYKANGGTVRTYPIVSADRPTGYWLDAREEDPCWYICSECKRMVDDDSNYCPNCGARMESDADGSD